MKYSKYNIVDIRRGKDHRSHIVYAHVKDTEDGRIVVSATLDYCASWIEDTLLNEAIPDTGPDPSTNG